MDTQSDPGGIGFPGGPAGRQVKRLDFTLGTWSYSTIYGVQAGTVTDVRAETVN